MKLKNRTLPPKLTTQSRQKTRTGASFSRPLGPLAVRAGANTSRKTEKMTPEKTGNKKACSTPTSDEAELPDNTLDFSVIPGR